MAPHGGDMPAATALDRPAARPGRCGRLAAGRVYARTAVSTARWDPATNSTLGPTTTGQLIAWS
ncbi:hypothetical protein ABT186_00650 [Streptomyces sp. NPDC001634]|uniref:hypothetical protein n=1 Tax=Streptomyces sp. NPDC001634 TaxID=3154390 RepID=UPI00331749CC